MWNDRKSLILSKACVILFMAALVLCAIFAPGGFGIVFESVSGSRKPLFLMTVYLGCVPAAALLGLLYSILHRLGTGQVFVGINARCLRYISWCCFAGAIISLASAFYWIAWLTVSIAAAFMGLIVRVVKNIVAKAISLQDEANYTI